MKKTAILAAVTTALSLAAGSAVATTISLTGNATPDAVFGTSILAINNGGFTAGNTFRVMNGGAASGFGEKAIVSGDEVWTFGDGVNLTAVAGSPAVGAVTVGNAGGTSVNTAGAGLFDPAIFFGGAFSILAPTVGSDAGNAFGAGSIQNIVGDNFEILMPVLEVHWAGSGSAFTLGEAEGGIVFSCSGYASAAGHCSADSLIDASEDSAGFAGQYTQWDFDIVVTDTPSAVPVPAAVWLFGSGLLGLVGVARRKKA